MTQKIGGSTGDEEEPGEPWGSCQLGRKGTQGLLESGGRKQRYGALPGTGFIVCSDPDQSTHAGREEFRRD